MMTTADPRVVAYLQRLEEAASGLRAERRAELVAEIRDHISSRLADLGPPAAGEDPVERTLARLGEPEEIVAAAADDAGTEVAPERGFHPSPRTGPGGMEAAALVLLLLGGFVAGIGWIAGVVLLWMSARFTVAEKLLATLVWPFGLAAPVFFGGLIAVSGGPGCPTTVPSAGQSVGQCSAAAANPLGIALLVASILAPIVVAVVLWVRASRRAAKG